MRQIRLCAFLVMIGAALSFAVAPRSARADATCTAFLASKWQQANAGNQWYTIELTMHRENVKFVSYSFGTLTPNPGGSFTGGSNQLFSDRGVTVQTGLPFYRPGQPFNINAADQLQLRLSPTGVLQIHYSPWNFDTTWDLSCKGSVLTSYLPGFGVVTLTFRDLFTPIQ